MSKQDPKTKILISALPDVAFDGWTQEVLQKAVLRAKASPARAFGDGDGVTCLVRHFSAWADEEMEQKLDAAKTEHLRARDKVTLALRTRLDILLPHRQAVSAALAYLMHPKHAGILPKLVWATADRIWIFAGDTSTDYNRYTKRLLLSGVITATTLYWLNDASKGKEDTWAFLDRRIENVLKIGGKLSAFSRRKEK